MFWACLATSLALQGDRGERERGCGRRNEKVRFKHCSIGRSRERVPRGSYCIELERSLRRGGRSARRGGAPPGADGRFRGQGGPGDGRGLNALLRNGEVESERGERE